MGACASGTRDGRGHTGGKDGEGTRAGRGMGQQAAEKRAADAIALTQHTDSLLRPLPTLLRDTGERAADGKRFCSWRDLRTAS